jgi:putative Mn2+ efflux pump MntP
MNIFLVLGIAFALAMDAFAVSLGISTALGETTKTQRLRLAFYFGFFQFLMPILGWSVGQSVQKYIQAFDHWVAFGLLLFIGGKMIYESFEFRKKGKKYDSDPTKGFSLLLLSVATSLDALAVGLSFALLGVGIVYPAAVIGLVAFILTLLGMKMGALLGHLIKKRGELLGGIILILIGVVILFEHL